MQPRSGRHRGPHTVAIALALVGTSLLIPAVSAEATDPAVQEANASSGGSASTTADGTIEIGEIVTGENTGNSILAGDITGAAAFDGGVIDSPTEVTVTQVIAPSIATASGGMRVGPASHWRTAETPTRI